MHASLRTLSLASVIFAACAAPDDELPLAEDTQAAAVNSVYSGIRAQEANFPLPTPELETVVGTFNASSGVFTGLQSTYDYELDEITGKPKKIRIIPHVDIDAVHVKVRFNIQNRGTQPVSLTVNNVTVNAPAGQSFVAINAEKANSVNWKLVVGARTKSDILKIDRPYHVGAGVFTVAALPVSVIYEPPQDSGLNNRTTYTITRSIANTLTMSFKEENSTTKAARPDRYESLAEIKPAIDNLVSVLQYAPNVPNKAAIITAFNTVSSLIGTVSAQQTNGTSNATDTSLTVKDTWSASLSTNAHMGPGAGDRIVYLKNARFVWVSDQGQLHIALLGYDSHVVEWVQILKDDLTALGPFPTRFEGVGATTGLPRDSLQALLALDPFVAGGPTAALDSSRFVEADPKTIEGSGGVDIYSVEHEVIATDRTSTSNFSTLVTDSRAGWLSFVGLGVTDTSTTRMTTTHSQSQELSISERIKTAVELHAAGSERYNIDVFYDRVFGGFAFRRAP